MTRHIRSICCIILNWNQAQLSLKCIDTVRSQVSSPAEIIVIDNGSTLSDRQQLASHLPAGTIFKPLLRNRGFAGGMNIGIREAIRRGYEFTWLLNNDAFPTPHCLNLLHDALIADSKLAAVTPHLHGPNREPQPTGGRYLYDDADTTSQYSEDMNQANPERGLWIAGTAPLFRTLSLSQAKGFDERFFAYWEDVDLCLRLAKLGYRFRAVPSANTFHLHQASTRTEGASTSAFALHLSLRNRFRMIRKHAPASDSYRQLFSLASTWLHKSGNDALNGKYNSATNICGAVLAGLISEAHYPKWYNSRKFVTWHLAKHPWKIISVFDFLQHRFDRRSILNHDHLLHNLRRK